MKFKSLFVVMLVSAVSVLLAANPAAAQEKKMKAKPSISNLKPVEEIEEAVDEGKQKEVKKEGEKVAEEKIAVIKTNKGVIKFKFFPEDAPKTVENFIKLAEEGFYKGLKFHRVVPNFVIQGGDPLGNGRGDAGYKIKAEFNKRQHLDGTVAMARAQDPDSASCQFYICLGAQPFLDGKYTVFGQVIEGLDVVHQIAIGDVMETVTIEPLKEASKDKVKKDSPKEKPVEKSKDK